jgi:hypothetical protein
LQRTITDFGADDSFGGGASAKLREHYGIEVPATVIREVTEKHGEAMVAMQRQEQSELPDRPGVAVLIAETDGTMVPVVHIEEPVTGEPPVDRRKNRKVDWKEGRLSLVHQPGSVTPIFSATMGTVDELGEHLWRSAIRAGAGSQTRFHCVGDGAPWITNQVDLRFGTQAIYLVDFFHLCEYVSRAAEVVAGKDKEAWIEEKKDWLKDNRWPDVLKSLQPYVEGEKVPDKDAPVRVCYRYIANRPRFLFSKNALAARKCAGGAKPDWLDYFMSDTWEPNTLELRPLKKALAAQAKKFNEIYRPIRHKVYAHRLVLDGNVEFELFEKTNRTEVRSILTFLRELMDAIEHLYLNGCKPVLGKQVKPGGYPEAIRRSVNSVLGKLAKRSS